MALVTGGTVWKKKSTASRVYADMNGSEQGSYGMLQTVPESMSALVSLQFDRMAPSVASCRLQVLSAFFNYREWRYVFV